MSTSADSDGSGAFLAADRAMEAGGRMLAQRVATAAVGAPLLIAAIWLGGWVLLAVVLLLCALGAAEFGRLADAAGYRTPGLVLAGALLFPIWAAWGRWAQAVPLAAGLAAAAAVVSFVYPHRPAAPSRAAITTLGVLYVGVLFSYLILMRDACGPAATLTVVGLIWVNDTAAFFAGSVWGRRRLAPSISPGKSVEGFLSGVAAAVGAAVILALLMDWSPRSLFGVGLGVALAAVAGDLWESALKRRAGVKDSGTLLPGHGGVLDRFDSVLFGVPAGYYLWRCLL